MKRRTVLVVSGNGPPILDGVGDYTHHLISGLAAARPEWRWVWLRRKPRWKSPPLRFSGSITVLQPWHSWSAVGRAAARAVVAAVRPDIVHIQEQTHSLHESPAAAELVRAARRSVVTVHEVHPEATGCRWTVEAAQRATAVFACDEATAEKCRAVCGRKPDGVWWSPANVFPQDAPPARVPGLVVTFGFLGPNKGLEELHAALAVARRRVPALRWRIVGPFDPERDPRHHALRDTLGGEWVEFTGGRPGVNDPQLRRWLSEAAVAALPYRDGATTRRGTLQAAWAFGTPVVTTPPVGGDTGVRPGENCAAVPLSDTTGWADAVARVLTDPAEARRLSDGSRGAAARFGWPRLAVAHLAAYDRLFDPVPGPRH